MSFGCFLFCYLAVVLNNGQNIFPTTLCSSALNHWPNTKCHNFIILFYWCVCVCFIVIVVWLPELWPAMCLWGHSDPHLWPLAPKFLSSHLWVRVNICTGFEEISCILVMLCSCHYWVICEFFSSVKHCLSNKTNIFHNCIGSVVTSWSSCSYSSEPDCMCTSFHVC